MSRFEKIKRTVGGKVLETFESRIRGYDFNEHNERKALQTAARIVENKPFVLLPFRERGIVTENRATAFIHVYQPNIWGQDIACQKGKLHKMTVGTAQERGIVSAELKIQNSSIRQRLRKAGKTDDHFFEAMIESAMIESAYYSRIGGVDMDEDSARRIDIAIMKRALRNQSVFNAVAKAIDFDINDPLALLQVSRTIDLTGYLQDVSEADPYFNRRMKQIDKFNEINSNKSAAWEHEKHGKIGDDFAIELMKRLAKKKKVDPWLVKAMESQLRNEDKRTLFNAI